MLWHCVFVENRAVSSVCHCYNLCILVAVVQASGFVVSTFATTKEAGKQRISI